MHSGKLKFYSAAFLLFYLAFNFSVRGQETGQTPSTQADDVIRITTELVQTDVMVFDRQGRFVDGLQPDQFELVIDGKPQNISFFERVAAGSSREAMQLAAARGGNRKDVERQRANTVAQDQGRLIFFFLDDLHLSGESLIRARKALSSYVDNRMRPGDQVAIVSTSGQIGFLQQLTDNRTVLQTAIGRLNYKMNPEAYTSKTRINEYMASQVLDHGNRELYAYLLEAIKVEQQSGPGIRHGDHRLASSYSAAPILRNRMRQVNTQGRMTTADTLESLQGLLLSSSALPGRKVVFFLSDGFIINDQKSGALTQLHRITETAARSGVLIYTMDLRSNFFSLGSGVDASTNDYIDLSGRRAGVVFGEISATQSPLKVLADETGGRAIFNASSIDESIQQAVNETSDYYLLAWRPDGETQRNGKARLKISVRNHPELRVRLRNNLYTPPSVAKGKAPGKDKQENAEASSANTTAAPEVELLAALGSLYPQQKLPVTISSGYVNTSASVMTLKVSMQIERTAFDFEQANASQKALVDVIGAAIDDRGVIVSFKQLVTVTPELLAQKQSIPVLWNQQLTVPPGLYQVRVAVRERQTGRTGSAQQWIEVPDLKRSPFQLSSLFLGERKAEALLSVNQTSAPQAVMVDVDHQYPRTSVLRYQTYVYNAARNTSNAPDVWIQTQVLRDDKTVMTLPLSRVPTEGSPDAARLPFWAEISLDQLPPGRYALQVTAIDRTTKTSATQRQNFVVE